MTSLQLEIPEAILDELRIPPGEQELTLLRELALALYTRDLLPSAAARKLSGMDRLAFDDLLGQRGVPSQFSVADLDDDLRNLDAWRKSSEP